MKADRHRPGVHWRPAAGIAQRLSRWAGRHLTRRRTLGLLGGLFFLYVYVAGDYGLYQLYVKWNSIDRLRTEIAALERERGDLLAQRISLRRGDPTMIERIARERYGMVRSGETAYRVRRTPEPETAP